MAQFSQLYKAFCTMFGMRDRIITAWCNKTGNRNKLLWVYILLWLWIKKFVTNLTICSKINASRFWKIIPNSSPEYNILEIQSKFYWLCQFQIIILLFYEKKWLKYELNKCQVLLCFFLVLFRQLYNLLFMAFNEFIFEQFWKKNRIWGLTSLQKTV